MRDEDHVDFSPERKLYSQLRPLYGKEECLFVPNSSHGLAGYVTFDKDARHVRAAVEQLGVPAYVARIFYDGTVLWLLDANSQRAQALSELSGCFIYFAYHGGPQDARRLPEDLPSESPWP